MCYVFFCSVCVFDGFFAVFEGTFCFDIRLHGLCGEFGLKFAYLYICEHKQTAIHQNTNVNNKLTD